MKVGSHTCEIKQINAERLEGFVFENLARTADDRQFIENLSLKMAYQTDGRAGLELLEVWSKTFEKTIAGTLQSFKNEFESASNIDRVQIIKRTIRRIHFKRESVEVLIRLNDTSPSIVGSPGLGPQGQRAAGIRGGAPTADAPAFASGSILPIGSPRWTRV